MSTKLKTAATRAGFAARTIRPTHLLRLWSESIPLPEGQALWIYREDGPYGMAYVDAPLGPATGSVLSADYQRV